jgi:hypothetical protein
MARQARRRSGRHRSAVPRYTDDVFEIAGLSDECSKSELSRNEQNDVYDLSDEEFNISGDSETKETRPLDNGDGFQSRNYSTKLMCFHQIPMTT